MDFLRHMKQGGKGYLMVFLLLLGAVLLIFSGRGEKETPNLDDRLPAISTKQALEQELAELIGDIEGIGAVRVSVSLESGNEYVYENGKNTLVYSYRVRGVAVVCDGGNDAVKREKIIQLLCSLLDLPMKSVSVTQ